MEQIVRQAKRGVIITIGGTVLFVGFVLLFLPGPGILLLLLGMVILASEFAWAKIVLDKAKTKISGK